MKLNHKPSYYGIIVTFNPDETIKKHLSYLVEQQTKLIIVDNGSVGIKDMSDLVGLHLSKSVIFIKLAKNFGLGYAQNKGIEAAIKKKAEFIFLLDQDSELPRNYFIDMISFYNKWKEEFKIGIVAPNFYDPNIKLFTQFAKLTRYFYKHIKCSDDKVREVSFAVASGSMIPVSVIKVVGLLDEKFFIDHIDSEYSLRLMEYGYKILVNCRITMNHTIGERTMHNFLGLAIKPNHHSPLRKYFIFRNGFRLVWKYGGKYPGFAILMLNRMVHDVIGILFFEKKKIQKILAVLHGSISSIFPFKEV